MRPAGAALVTLLAVTTAALAQADATAAEEAAIHAWVDYRAIRARYGDAHESTRDRAVAADAARAELEAAIGRGARVDVDAVRAHLEAELAEVQARLAEIGVRCGGPAVEVVAAEARRDALADAVAALGSGRPFVPAR